MYSWMYLVLILIFQLIELKLCVQLRSSFTLPSSECPFNESIPCMCHESNGLKVIKCVGNAKFDISGAFRDFSSKVSTSLSGELNGVFHVFHINNTALHSIPANVFHNITFKYIFFDGAILLKYIHPNAFLGTENEIERVFAWNTNLESYKVPNDHDAFARLRNLRELDISNGNEMFCPQEESIAPCFCEVNQGVIGIEGIAMRDEYVIRCDGDQPYYLRQIFQRISTDEPTCARHYDSLHLDNTKWTNFTEITSNAFEDVTFTKVSLQFCSQEALEENIEEGCESNNNRYNLTIHPKAFGKTSSFVQHIKVSTSLPSTSNHLKDTFTAINSLPNLRSVTILAGFQVLPSHSFRNIMMAGHGQSKLIDIKITGGTLETIQSYAFYALPNLNTIDLSGNAISKINRHAFAFRSPSDHELVIDLTNNAINSSSFEAGALTQILRPTTLILANENSKEDSLKDFEYLDEDVFAPFLACGEGYVIHLGSCSLTCDCRMQWLIHPKLPIHWRKQIFSENENKIKCQDGKSLYDDFREEDLQECET